MSQWVLGDNRQQSPVCKRQLVGVGDVVGSQRAEACQVPAE